MVAKAELEAVHGFLVPHRELGHRLNNVVRNLCSANNQRPDMQDKSKKQYARHMVRRVNMLEPGMEGQKKHSKTGDIKVAGLSHKYAKTKRPKACLDHVPQNLQNVQGCENHGGTTS